MSIKRKKPLHRGSLVYCKECDRNGWGIFCTGRCSNPRRKTKKSKKEK